jgi:hypothetical protein
MTDDAMLFPMSWSGEKISRFICEMVKDPSLPWIYRGKYKGKERYSIDGTREGVCIRVIIEPKGKGVITAYRRHELEELKR